MKVATLRQSGKRLPKERKQRRGLLLALRRSFNLSSVLVKATEMWQKTLRRRKWLPTRYRRQLRKRLKMRSESLNNKYNLDNIKLK